MSKCCDDDIEKSLTIRTGRDLFLQNEKGAKVPNTVQKSPVDLSKTSFENSNEPTTVFK